MTNEEMILFVESEMKKGLNRFDAIRNLAWYLDDDDPVMFGHPEDWFNNLLKNSQPSLN